MHLTKLGRREMVQKLENEVTDVVAQKNPPSPKSRLGVLRRNKKASNASDPFRFEGQGVTYKGKLIGERDVEGARGDGMCAEAMRVAKAAVKAAGAHKTRIILQINIDGIKILDEKSNAVMFNFPVSRISFIARDTSDARAFGLVFGDSTNKYKFYGIKTAQTADQAVLAIRDMFQVVFEMKKKHIEQVKQQQENPTESAAAGVAVADLLDLETELHNLEQGVQHLQQIPTDPFGATPFNDPFTDSFASNASSVMSNSVNMNSSLGNTSIPQQAQQQNLFGGFQSPAQISNQQQAWAQSTPTSLLTTQQQQQPQNYQTTNFNNTSPFSQTNPFASAVYGNDPFSARSVPQIPAQAPAVPAAAPAYQTSIDWGVNENAVPQTQTINFASFDSQPAKQDYKWDEPKRVTSLEEAFSKLVDMDSIVGPTETKKNPFEHILNPPKATLNSIGAAQRTGPQAVVVAPTSNDPFGDDFFR